MSRGRYRPGAGRPKGAKNKVTLLREVAVQYGVTPLDYRLSIMRDETQPVEMRLLAARAALPFCHPRLAAVHQAEDHDHPDHETWVHVMEQKLAQRPCVECPAL